MTRLEKLENANNKVQEIEISPDIFFFTKLLPEKMEAFLNLTYFNEIKNKEFQDYLNFNRLNLVIHGIKFSKESELNESDRQKEFTLSRCKDYTKSMLKCIKLAFEHYIKNHDALLKEED